MSGPKGVITVGSSFEHVYECNVESLAVQLQGMAEEAMDSKQRHAGNFEPTEGTKDIPLNPKTPDGKVLKISATLDNK